MTARTFMQQCIDCEAWQPNTCCDDCRKRRQDILLEKRDREPLPPPYAVGTVLTYTGPDLPGESLDGPIAIRMDALPHGSTVEVHAIYAGERGTLEQLYSTDGLMYGDEEGQKRPVVDRTTDGISFLRRDGRHVFGRMIKASGADQWGGMSPLDFSR